MDPLSLIGGIFSGAASYFTQQNNNREQVRVAQENTDKTIAANRQLAEYGYSKDLEMWNKQNQYNTPQAQMQRIRAAGLNPNLVYGTGSVSGNTGGTTPKYQAPTVDYKYQPRQVDLPSMIGNFQNFQLQKANIDNVKAQTAATYQNTANSVLDGILKQSDVIEKPAQAWATTRGLEASAGLKETELKQALNSQKFQLAILQHQARQAASEAGLSAEKLLTQQEDTKYKQETNKWRQYGIMDTDNPLWRLFIKNNGPEKMKQGLNQLPPWMQWANPFKD